MGTINSYGTWRSPITSERIVAESVSLSEVVPTGDAIYWNEGRPSEKGRYVIVRRGADGNTVDLNALPVDGVGTPFNARTRVHEYGGGAWLVAGGTAYFSNFDDQRLYQVPVKGGTPVPVSPAYEVTVPRDGGSVTLKDVVRYADITPDLPRRRLICVMEDHHKAFRPDGSEDVTKVVNTLAAVSLDGVVDPAPLTSGHDFYSNPRISPDGKRLAWLTWDHPRMPWVGTELWVAEIAADGSLTRSYKAAGSPSVSVFQPEWSPDGRLYYISDDNGWWNLYRHDPAGPVAVCPRQAEFGQPQWNFGMSTYAFRSATEVICTYKEGGIGKLARLDLNTRREPVPLNLGLVETLTEFSSIRTQGDRLVFLGGSPALPSAYYLFDLNAGTPAKPLRWALQKVGLAAQGTDTVAAVPEHSVGDLKDYFSTPIPIEFPTASGNKGHGFFYPPHSPTFSGPSGETPPLVVKCHGGPTAATSSTLDLRIQYWTSRGIAVLDVDYGGSTGYGRTYRDRLNLSWGIVDVDDCVNGAKYLAGLSPDGNRDASLKEQIDPTRAVITGGSAGGYTTLAALTFKDFFKGGASYYGVSDTEALVRDTHKFESRYLDWLIGPYPMQKAVYQERSPIHHVDLLASRKTPVIFFQGDEDKIVPPNQTEMMVEALKKVGVPVGYILFQGEQHGFRKADNIQRALDSELLFYSVMVIRSGLKF